MMIEWINKIWKSQVLMCNYIDYNAFAHWTWLLIMGSNKINICKANNFIKFSVSNFNSIQFKSNSSQIQVKFKSNSTLFNIVYNQWILSYGNFQ